MNDRYNGFVCDVETAEYIRQMANAYGISKAAYLRRVLEEDQERKKDILPKLNKIKDLQAEIRQKPVSCSPCRWPGRRSPRAMSSANP